MNIRRLLVPLVLSLFLAPVPVEAAGRTVTILHVSDTHSHLDATGPRDATLNGTVGGIAKATTVIGTARAAVPDALLLHAGDLFQGDVFFNAAFGVPELQWMAAVGFDAMALGNHDFDLGPENLAGIVATASGEGGVPLLSANTTGLEAYGLSAFRASLIKSSGGVRVGIFALTVPDDPMCQAPPGMLDPDLPAVAKREVAGLRAAGAEVVILISHLGLVRDEALAGEVSGIDAIISGHDHATLHKPIEVPTADGGTTFLVESGPFYANIGKLQLEVDAGRVRLAGYELLPVDASVPPEPAVEAEVEGLKAYIEAAYGPVFSREVGRSLRDMASVGPSERGRRDSPAGNLVADAFRAAGKTDVAFTTAGLISEGLSRGPLVPADLFRVVSYGYDPETGLGFNLLTCAITGAELAKALEIGVAGLGPEDPFFPQLSGMSFSYASDLAPGERVNLSSIRVRGEPLDPVRTYTLTVNAAVAMFFPLLGIEVSELSPLDGVFEFTALLAYVEQMGVLDLGLEGRVRDVAWQRDWSLDIPQPVFQMR